MELYYLLAKNYDQVAMLTNSDTARGLALDAWYKVIRLADKSVGRELIWAIEADDAVRNQSTHN